MYKLITEISYIVLVHTVIPQLAQDLLVIEIIKQIVT